MTRPLPCCTSQPSAPGAAGPKKSPARRISTLHAVVRRRAQPPLQLDADRALAGDRALRRVLADRRAGVRREVVDAGRARPAARRRPWPRRWRSRPSAAPCPSSCDSRGGLAAWTISCAPSAAATTLAASIASPFTQSIGRARAQLGGGGGGVAGQRPDAPAVLDQRLGGVQAEEAGGADDEARCGGSAVVIGVAPCCGARDAPAVRLNGIAIIRAVDIHFRMDSWDHYRSLLAVLDEGSLSGAARQLGLTQPTVGRHIEALESRARRAALHPLGQRPRAHRDRAGAAARTPRRWRRPPRRWSRTASGEADAVRGVDPDHRVRRRRRRGAAADPGRLPRGPSRTSPSSWRSPTARRTCCGARPTSPCAWCGRRRAR